MVATTRCVWGAGTIRTFVALCRRDMLSILSAALTFLMSCYLWNTLGFELKTARAAASAGLISERFRLRRDIVSFVLLCLCFTRTLFFGYILCSPIFPRWP